MNKVKIVVIKEKELRELIHQEVSNAVRAVLEAQNDELVTVKQVCEKIPGMSRYRFNQLKNQAKLVNVQGKYSLKSVREAVQKYLQL